MNSAREIAVAQFRAKIAMDKVVLLVLERHDGRLKTAHVQKQKAGEVEAYPRRNINA